MVSSEPKKVGAAGMVSGSDSTIGVTVAAAVVVMPAGEAVAGCVGAVATRAVRAGNAGGITAAAAAARFVPDAVGCGVAPLGGAVFGSGDRGWGVDGFAGTDFAGTGVAGVLAADACVLETGADVWDFGALDVGADAGALDVGALASGLAFNELPLKELAVDPSLPGRFQPTGGTICTMLLHLGHARMSPITVSSLTMSFALHVVQ